MSLAIYNPESDRIVHKVRVDLSARTMIQAPINLIQYDSRLPIVAVSLFKDNIPYTITSDYTAAIRWGRQGEEGCYNASLGADETYHTVYFEVTPAMSAIAGNSEFVVEIVHGGNVVGSSPIATKIKANPVTAEEISKAPEYTAITEYVAQAEEAANRAEDAQEACEFIEESVTDLANEMTQIKTDAITETTAIKTATEQIKSDTNDIKTATEQIKADAITEITAIKTETEQIKSDTNDIKTATEQVKADAITETTAIKTETEQIKSDTNDIKTATEQIKAETKIFKDAAEEDAADAYNSAIESKSWAVGGTGTREGEDSNNAKYWSDQAKATAQGDFIPNADRGVSVATLVDGKVPKAQIPDFSGDYVNQNEVGVTIAELVSGKVPDSQLPDPDIATSDNVGVVKPDGTTITVDADGTIHGASQGVEVEKLTLAQWQAKHDAGTLEDGMLYDTTDEVGEDVLLETLATKTEVSSKANKPTSENVTLLSASWVGDEAPYTYDLGISNDYDIELLPKSDMTDDEYAAFVSAQIVSNGDNNTIYARGDKPEIDLRIVVRRYKK